MLLKILERSRNKGLTSHFNLVDEAILQRQRLFPVSTCRALAGINEEFYSCLFENEEDELAAIRRAIRLTPTFVPPQDEAEAWQLAAVLKLVDLYLWEIDQRSFGNRGDSTFLHEIEEGRLLQNLTRLLEEHSYDYRKESDRELSLIVVEIVNALGSISPTNMHLVHNAGLLEAICRVLHPSKLVTL